MKSRSAIFVLVLLLLTVTVCAAQSPMGFSPEKFYRDFKEYYPAQAGLECNYSPGNEEIGAFILFNKYNAIYLTYSGNDVTEVCVSFVFLHDDDQTLNDSSQILWSTLITLAVESGATPDNITSDTLMNLISDLFTGEQQEFCGYLLELTIDDDETTRSGLLSATKSVDSNSSSKSYQEIVNDWMASYRSSGSQAVDKDTNKAFSSLVDKLIAENVIPTGGTYYYKNDYTDEWAQIDWYQWSSFDKLKNFVLSATVSWQSAHDRPNTFSAGCGVVFRENGTDNMLEVSLRMDGYVYMTGYRSGYYLSYPKVGFGSSQIKATHQFVVVANGDVVTVYVDGMKAARWSSVAITDEGYIGLATMSGTNKDYGTRCEWKDIYYYTW